ncbi:hypothetical protein A0126_18895 (plasmid) [Exiguobacterium sp. N4-1P]|uniref:hypothetical protein n=1 Tax=Exiguobacterium sp. N4-1P TaxID=2051906 RepID=UPI000B58A919|nr:hypothetical protein [Exiguobacterium sp. N4-1P]ASI36882.1 hypothetical protein A0126_15215 [Exiguobacterium sp. N4-1P]ASI37655.1 hypothetical protein A0126_18895 [Exiguobacterium sp. N4-1P]
MSKSKENNFWKTSFFSGIGPVIFTGLITFSIAYMNLIADGKTKPISFKGFSLSEDVQFILLLSFVVFIVLLTLRSIRNAIVKYNDSKQETESLGGSFYGGNIKGNLVFRETSEVSFFFETESTVSSDLYGNDNSPMISNVYVNDISGPFCNQDDLEYDGVCGTELTESKTFFGRYTYECVGCGKRIKSNYSSPTLRAKVEKLTLSSLKKQLKTGQLKR